MKFNLNKFKISVIVVTLICGGAVVVGETIFDTSEITEDQFIQIGYDLLTPAVRSDSDTIMPLFQSSYELNANDLSKRFKELEILDSSYMVVTYNQVDFLGRDAQQRKIELERLKTITIAISPSTGNPLFAITNNNSESVVSQLAMFDSVFIGSEPINNVDSMQTSIIDAIRTAYGCGAVSAMDIMVFPIIYKRFTKKGLVDANGWGVLAMRDRKQNQVTGADYFEFRFCITDDKTGRGYNMTSNIRGW